MTHDSHDTHTHAPSQGVFIGGLAIGLLGLMAVFSVFVLVAGFL
jgi:predicted lipid-binding transport protein (Tim44 family)